MFKLDKVKGSFFLVTLPDTIDYIINNLLTQKTTSFTNLKPKMLDLAKKHTINQLGNSSAYAASNF